MRRACAAPSRLAIAAAKPKPPRPRLRPPRASTTGPCEIQGADEDGTLARCGGAVNAKSYRGSAHAGQALHAAHALHHLHQAAALHLLHHPLHLLELIEQAVDLLHLHAGAGGDAALAAGLDELGLAALQRRHRADDAFHAAHVALGAVHVGLAGLRLAHHLRRQLVDQARQAAHLLHLRDLREEVVEVEAGAALDLVGQLLRGLQVHALLHFLDEGDDVAHAEHAAGVALGIEHLEPVDLLADAGELDRRAGDLPHRECRAAARIAVEL